MDNVFLIGSMVQLSTVLRGASGQLSYPLDGVVVTVTKGGVVKATGMALQRESTVWSYTYHPSPWETGIYTMSFSWNESDGASGAVPQTQDLAFALSASLPTPPINPAKKVHPCDFDGYQNINLRCEFDEMICKQGKWLVLLTRDSYEHCDCWNPTMSSAKSNCSRCFGTGYPLRKEYVRSRRVIEQTEGNIFDAGRQLVRFEKFYVQWSFQGGKGDLLWEVNWKDPANPELGWSGAAVRRYAIEYVIDMYGDGDNGAVSYKVVRVEEIANGTDKAKVT